MTYSPKDFLDQLVAKQVLTQEQANSYQIDSLQKNIPIDEYLMSQTQVDKHAVLEVKAQALNVPYIDIMKTPLDSQALGILSEQIARKYNVLAYAYDQTLETIQVATAEPLNSSLREFLEQKTRKRVVFSLAYHIDITRAIEKAFSQNLSPDVTDALQAMSPRTQSPQQQPQQQQPQQAQPQTDQAPIAKIVYTVLEYAVKGRASDVHIEPQETKTRVRYRIDGILEEKLTLPKSIHDNLVSRIKILAEMKIDEKRLPQDGRFAFKSGDIDVDLRVATLPTVNGEKVVMRVLQKSSGIPQLHDLGLRGPQLAIVEEAIVKPNGMIFVTGPTGSGKTTTLYSILSKLNKPTTNILTLEDPVEYEIIGINQVQINPQAGLTFANGMRSFLRQDPNIILVGEVRDPETTQLAIQAALTGHLVFSTLHTNDAATAIPRLIDLGGEPFLISSVLNLSIAQRIVRKVCPHCKEPESPSEEIQTMIRQELGNLLPANYKQGEPFQLQKGKGCEKCGGSGYYGRIAIFETLKNTPTINKLILSQSSAKEIEETAFQEGLITMKQDGFLKALEGITTVEEVLRVAESY